MRITNNMIARGMLNNVNAQLRRMDTLHYQLGSGTRLRVPSDDPAATATSMRLHTHLGQTRQHRENVNSAVSWLEATDSVLHEVTTSLQRAKDLAIYGANGANPQEAREALAAEVDQILQHMVDLANSTHAGLYLFSGNETMTKPYDLDQTPPGATGFPQYNGDTGERRYEIGSGVTVSVNMPGSKIFGDGADGGILQTLVALSEGLKRSDTETVGGTVLGELEDQLDSLLSARADIGARANRLGLASERLTELELNIEQLLLETEGVDVARALTDLKVSENVYRSALASGARIIQPTLLDFLR